MSKALMFSGQGSQYVGMAFDLYNSYEIAKKYIEKADELLKFKISEIMFNGPLEVLKETRYTQPALFLHSVVAFELVKDKLEFSCVAGHSVGEYAALYSAGVLSFEEALDLVALRGELMFRAGEKMPGTMFAIIGMDDEKVEKLCEELNKPEESKIIVAANYNSPGQVVISGSADYLRENAQLFKNAGAKMVTELVVSGAFHSPLMEPAKKELAERINQLNFNDAKVPVYTNVFAKPEQNGLMLKDALIQQLTMPVRWTDILKNMFADGIDTFIEVGAGKVLQGLVKRTLSGVNIDGIDKAEDVKKYLES